MGYTQEFGQGERALTRAAELVSQARTELNQIAGELDVQIQGVNGQWGGAGGRAFQILHAAWMEKQTMINNALDTFASSLTETEHDNIATDEAQSANYASLSGRLDGTSTPTI